MATERQIWDTPLVAGADLSAKQYYLGGLLAAGTCGLCDGSTEKFVVGPIQNKPESGEAVSLRVLGMSKVVCGGNITIGDPLKSHTDGTAVTQSSGRSFGRAMEAGVAGRIIKVLCMAENV